MSQVLKSLQLVTQSYSGTPSTGTGALFASGSTLYFENATGTLFPLGATGGGSGYFIVKEYTGSAIGNGATQSFAWSNNSSIKYIQVICVGGGGGGGSGRYGGSGQFQQGGSGGGGGSIAYGFFDSTMLTQPSYPIIIGGGGAGGIRTSNDTNGNRGLSGGNTSFGGTLVVATGGSGGGGGLTNQVQTPGTGSSINCLPGPGFAIPGGTGANNLNAGTVTPTNNFLFSPLSPEATAGGGAGGGWALTIRPATSGASGYQWNTLQTNTGAPGAPGGSGSNNLVTAAVLLQFTSSVFTTTYGLGGGGHGGNGNTGSAAFNGGNGGLYGAGGGGGGGAQPATALAGNGGSGSSGLCIVVEYY